MDPSSGVKLGWIELGRGLAALCVVLSHYSKGFADGSFAFLRPLGVPAVEFFFVLSGFIIFHVHGQDVGQPSAIGRYAWRRWLRIFPTYWIILTLYLLLRPFQPTLRDIPLSFADIVNEAIMAPDRVLMIGQAWTLRHELLFYAVFGFLLLNKRLGFSVFVGWMAAAAANLILSGPSPGHAVDPVSILLHHYNLDFALGMAAAIATRHDRLHHMAGATIMAALAFAVGYGVFDSDVCQVLLSKAVFAAILCATIIASRRSTVPAPMLLLGAASYALYISHELVGTVMLRAARMLALDPLPTLLSMVSAAVVFAIAFHLVIERTILGWLRNAAKVGPDGARRPRADREGAMVSA